MKKLIGLELIMVGLWVMGLVAAPNLSGYCGHLW